MIKSPLVSYTPYTAPFNWDNCWEIPFEEKSKISQMMLKANIFEL